MVSSRSIKNQSLQTSIILSGFSHFTDVSKWWPPISARWIDEKTGPTDNYFNHSPDPGDTYGYGRGKPIFGEYSLKGPSSSWTRNIHLG